MMVAPNYDYDFKLEAEALTASNKLIASIAISLKRIADILDQRQVPVIMDAEEFAKYQNRIKK